MPKVNWQIQFKGKQGDDDTFAFYNPSMDRYAKVNSTEKVPHVKATKTPGDDSRFFIVTSMGYLSFFPVKLKAQAVYAEGLNNGARLRVAEVGTKPPALARWVVIAHGGTPAKPGTA